MILRLVLSHGLAHIQNDAGTHPIMDGPRAPANNPTTCNERAF